MDNITDHQVSVNSLNYVPDLGWVLLTTINSGKTDPHLCIDCAAVVLRQRLIQYIAPVEQAVTYPACAGHNGIPCTLPAVVHHGLDLPRSDGIQLGVPLEYGE